MKKKRTLSFLLTFLLLMSTSVIHAASIQPTPFDRVLIEARIWCDDIVPDRYDYYIRDGFVTLPASEVPASAPSNQYYLVVVDTLPGSGLAKPCKLVYVNKYMTYSDKNQLSINTIVKDAKSLPSDIKLTPLHVKDRYANKLLPMLDIKSGSVNKFADKTYAVIINASPAPWANATQYWNDCSYIYKVLERKYGIPKSNIMPVMPYKNGQTVLGYVNNGTLKTTPLDFDGDGKDEELYPSTRHALDSLFTNLPQLGDENHLMIFVTGNGGYDYEKGIPYLPLGNERIYPADLKAYLDNVDAGYVSIVMGQSYAGGFEKYLKADNHIFISAAGDGELAHASADVPYSEFLYNFTSALNEADGYGNGVDFSGVSKANTGARKSLSLSFAYAKNASKFLTETTPEISLLTNTTANDLALDTIPDVEQLQFADYRKKGAFIYSNPYIWIRNENDGNTVEETQRPIIDEVHNYVYLYTKVYNHGVKPFDSKMYVNYCWTNSSLVIPADMWKGLVNGSYDMDEHGVYGATAGTKTIKDRIAPGDSITLEHRYYFTDSDFDEASADNFNMCVLAYMTKLPRNYNFPLDEGGYADLKNCTRLVQNNTISKDFGVQDKEYYYAVLPNISVKDMDCSVYVVPNASTKRLLTDAEVGIKISEQAVASLNSSNFAVDGIRKSPSVKGQLDILSPNSCIRSLRLAPQQVEKVSVNCNFKADTDITEAKTYDVQLMVVDNKTGNAVGGQTYRFVSKPRIAMDAEIYKTIQPGKTTLSAGNVSEESTYEWYDENGNLVGTGASISVPSSSSSKEYSLKIKAKSDGAVIYRNTTVGSSSMIDKVTPSVSGVDVKLTSPAYEPLSVQLASSTADMPVVYGNIQKGVAECHLNISNFTPGVYQVSVLSDGNLIETRKFIK